jgi:hypothetical protein
MIPGNPTPPRLLTIFSAGFLGLVLTSLATGQEFSRAQLDYFEGKVRPVLIKHCYECHSHKTGTSEGGLYLDTRAGMIKGGESGTAVVPGNPSRSLLITAIGYANEDLQMPPKDEGGKLNADVVADLTKWVEMGAPAPASKPPVAPAHDMEGAKKHWAFLPIVKPNLPKVSDPNWARNPVDAFVYSNLSALKLPANEMAERPTLLRRVTYDLTGLPPTYQEMQAFLQDDSEQAYGKVVDRLLSSQAYGERWGRFWLDVARYADTRGYRTGGKQERFPFSHTYRDYVVSAFNNDKPYDQFILEQIAADQLQLGDDKTPLAAMGFLTLGRRFIDNQVLIIDDRIDVVTRGLMGVTVTCARCHDHKFDPVPTADYYSLYGVFASSTEPSELPLIGGTKAPEKHRSYLEAVQRIRDTIERIKNTKIDEYIWRQREKTGDYLLTAHLASSLPKGADRSQFVGNRKLDIRMFGRWDGFLKNDKNWDSPFLSGWRAVAAKAAQWPENTPAVIRESAATPQATTLEKLVPLYNQICKTAQKSNSDRFKEIREFLNAESSPTTPPRDTVAQWIARAIGNDTAKHNRNIEALNWTHDGAPSRAQVLVDRPHPYNPRIFRRGNPSSPGDAVPRRFLEFLAGDERKPFANGSGRLELAQEIVSPSNPLTARVLVNRLWGWHFGRALVDTPSDFGIRTAKPTQSELLDWLAADFVENKWSIKQLQKKIVTSRTYRQSSRISDAAFQADPGNQLWHHFPRQRLSFEAMRDTLLFLGGTLDPQVGGISVDITRNPSPPRRTLYGFIDRQKLPGLYRTFDFPSPDATSPQRYNTTVPQQALFMMNSPFVIAQTRALVQRVTAESQEAPKQVERLYHIVFQRSPRAEEKELALTFLASKPAAAENRRGLSNLERFAQALLLSNEVIFVD